MEIARASESIHYDEGVYSLHQILLWSQPGGSRTAGLERRLEKTDLTLLLEESPKWHELPVVWLLLTPPASADRLQNSC